MARRRGNQKGTLYVDGDIWKARWYVDAFDASGRRIRRKCSPWIIGRAKGPGKMKRQEAVDKLAEKMREVNASQGPLAAFTLGDFIEQSFIPDYVMGEVKTRAGRIHYLHILDRHVTPAFHDMPIGELDRRLVSKWLRDKKSHGLKASTLTKMRNVLVRVYNYAAECSFYTGRNPASGVKIPPDAVEITPTQAYSIDEMRILLRELPEPLNTMFALGACTSMHGSELAGLRIEHVNLSTAPRQIHNKVVGPGELYVLEGYACNERTAGKTKDRRRVLPIPAFLHDRLRANLKHPKTGEFRDGNEPLFVMPMTWIRHKRAIPVDTHNAGRVLRPLSKRLGFQVSWHRLRATWATQAHTLGMASEDMAEGMGHASGEMSMHYADVSERLRMTNEAIAQRLIGMDGAGGTVQ